MFPGLISWLNVLRSGVYALTVLLVLSHSLAFPSGEVAKNSSGDLANFTRNMEILH